MRSAILLSVRNKATRLPGKVLLPLGPGNVTEVLIRRLKPSRRADAIVLATSVDVRDRALCDLARAEGIECFRGSEDDKLMRYRDAARAFGFEFVVVVDGDDPLVSVSHIDRLVEAASARPVDFITWRGLPLGATGFGVGAGALERICAEKTVENTEVWGHLFTDDASFRCETLTETDPLLSRPEFRMTLDYPEDHDFFRAVIAGLEAEGAGLDFESVMAWLDRHPECAAINRDAQAAYERHLAASAGADA